MQSLPFALSIHNFIHSVGADCGFAAIIAVALLILMYFAHARETAHLRDGLDEAHEHIQSLELRISQLAQQQASNRAQPTGVRPGVAPPPVVARPMGATVAALRQTPAASAVRPAGVTDAATSVTSTVSAAAAGTDATTLPAAAQGLGAPNLGSATKLIPDPPRSGASVAPRPFGAEQALAGGEQTIAGEPVPADEATGVWKTPAGGNGDSPTPPRVQIRPGTAAATPGTSVPRRTVPLAGTPRNDAPQPGHSRTRRIVPVIIGLVIIAIVVFALVQLTGGGSSGAHKTGVNHHTKSSKTKKAKAFKASRYTVSVLNGTAVDGLAADVSAAIDKKGFKPGSVTNAATQTEVASVVYYRKAADKIAAQHVAAQLGLKMSQVRPATKVAVESCATSPAGGTSSCNAEVIVSVGSDQSSLATSGTASS